VRWEPGRALPHIHAMPEDARDRPGFAGPRSPALLLAPQRCSHRLHRSYCPRGALESRFDRSAIEASASQSAHPQATSARGYSVWIWTGAYKWDRKLAACSGNACVACSSNWRRRRRRYGWAKRSSVLKRASSHGQSAGQPFASPAKTPRAPRGRAASSGMRNSADG